MGHDKALLVVDGTPMVRRVVDAAHTAAAAQIATVGGDPAALTSVLGTGTRVGARDPVPGTIGAPGVAVVEDRWPGEGPLGGIVTSLDALGAHDVDVVLVVACDLLDPSPVAMRAVVDALAASPDHDVAVPVAGRRRQWLHTAWRRSVAPRLEAAFTSGLRSVHQGITHGGLTVLELADIAPDALADADTPADLQAAGRSWATLPGHGGPTDRRRGA